MTDKYILVGHIPMPTDDLFKWGEWMESGNRKVATTQVNENVRVSTVFLGLDHSFGEGPPLLFETMIFGGEHDDYQRRYTTWAGAEAGHEEAVRLFDDA